MEGLHCIPDPGDRDPVGTHLVAVARKDTGTAAGFPDADSREAVVPIEPNYCDHKYKEPDGQSKHEARDSGQDCSPVREVHQTSLVPILRNTEGDQSPEVAEEGLHFPSSHSVPRWCSESGDLLH